jgi:predicted nucleotidyltransferase
VNLGIRRKLVKASTDLIIGSNCPQLQTFKYLWYKIMGIRDKIMGAKLVFITPTLMKIFEFFLENPMNEYHEREIVRKTSVSKGSAGKILKLLTNIGFLTREEKGRMALYRLNMKEPTVRQFKILVNTFGLKNLVDRIKQHSSKVVLFGSCSQGTDMKDSDIDLMVITTEKEQVKKTISEFNQKNERKIAPIVVTMNEYILMKKEDKPLHENIERGITLWEAE